MEDKSRGQKKMETAVADPRHTFVVPIKSDKVNENETATLETELNVQDADVVWWHEGKRIVIDGKKYVVEVSNFKRLLIINSSQIEDCGEYWCTTKDDKTTTKLIVDSLDENFVVKPDDNKKFTKTAGVWFGNGKKKSLTPGGKVETRTGNETNTLHIYKEEMEEADVYGIDQADLRGSTNVFAQEAEKQKAYTFQKNGIEAKGGESRAVEVPFQIEEKKMGDPKAEILRNGKSFDGKTKGLGEVVNKYDAQIVCIDPQLADTGKRAMEQGYSAGTASAPSELFVDDQSQPPKGPLETTNMRAESGDIIWSTRDNSEEAPKKAYIVEVEQGQNGQWKKIDKIKGTDLRSVEGMESATRRNSSYWVIQGAKKTFVSVFEGVFRLKSGSEILPSAPCELTSPNQPNGSIQKPKEENGPPGYEIEGSETAHSATTQKMETKNEEREKLLSKNTTAEAAKTLSTENRKNLIAKRDKDDLHQIIVPEREERIAKKDDESFLENLYFFHGFLPQIETIMFIKRGGDFLLRKWEDEGQDFLVVSVGVLLDYTRDGSEDLDKNYGKEEPVRINDHIVHRNSTGVFIDEEITFDCLEDMLGYYIFHPNKASLSIQLKRACPKRVFQFSANEIEKKKTLGAGAFGEVFQAEVKCIGMAPVKVAVKALLKDSANLNELSERMLDEARTMLRLRHEHVIGIYGWAIDKQPFMILIEMMESGSLDSFLLRKFDESNNSRLLKFALQAAKGLEYLHAMQFLHRDVAARNCLLSSDLTLKISDLGLATAGVFYFMTKAEKLPTRYLAPETLSTFVFVQATDFFCFGNLLYEIFSGGLMPYEELSSADARQKILNGEMNDLSETRCPPTLRSFVEDKMWTYRMKDRAQMREAVDFLKVLYKESKKAEGEPKTTTQETEQSLGNEDAEGVKKGRPPKKRRSKPIRRQELLEDLCPTQEETAQNED